MEDYGTIPAFGTTPVGQSVSVNPTGSVFRLAEQGHQDFLATIPFEQKTKGAN
jgi:hypothetical protein